HPVQRALLPSDANADLAPSGTRRRVPDDSVGAPALPDRGIVGRRQGGHLLFRERGGHRSGGGEDVAVGASHADELAAAENALASEIALAADAGHGAREVPGARGI